MERPPSCSSPLRHAGEVAPICRCTRDGPPERPSCRCSQHRSCHAGLQTCPAHPPLPAGRRRRASSAPPPDSVPRRRLCRTTAPTRPASIPPPDPACRRPTTTTKIVRRRRPSTPPPCSIDLDPAAMLRAQGKGGGTREGGWCPCTARVSILLLPSAAREVGCSRWRDHTHMEAAGGEIAHVWRKQEGMGTTMLTSVHPTTAILLCTVKWDELLYRPAVASVHTCKLTPTQHTHTQTRPSEDHQNFTRFRKRRARRILFVVPHVRG